MKDIVHAPSQFPCAVFFKQCPGYRSRIAVVSHSRKGRSVERGYDGYHEAHDLETQPPGKSVLSDRQSRSGVVFMPNCAMISRQMRT